MQVFEFHFNPKLKPDLIFDSFCYEPENIYERKMGSLYMVGILKNTLPKNLQLLEKIAKLIKEEYYKKTIFTPEKSLKESLKEANDFLEQIAKKGDVSWLGNLSFAVLSLTSYQKPWSQVKLNFTKVGVIKIFLIRGRKIIDIDKKLRFQDIEPYPLKIFGNIVSGKLAENDLILVFTKEVFDFFQRENLLDEISKLSLFNEKNFKEILDKKKEALIGISGICLAIFLTKEILKEKREKILPKISKEFSLKEVFSPYLKFLKFPKIRIPKLDVEALRIKTKSLISNKKLILVLSFILVLLFGFIFAKLEERQKIKIYQKNLEEIEEKLSLAESFLILENPQTNEKANSLLKEGFEEISPIVNEAPNLPKYFSEKVFSLRDKILEKLYSLNKLEKIEEPELIFEFKAGEFIPQKFLVFNNNLYFFSPYAKNLFRLKDNGEKEIIEMEQKFNLTTEFNNEILFFSKPAQIFLLKSGEEKPTPLAVLKEPYPDFSFDDFSSFKENLYFFDRKAGQVVKYPYLGNFQWGNPEFWLKKAIMGKAISVDGSVWVLEKDNSLSKYYAGNLQEKIELDIFPEPKEFSKILTSPTLPYLYILEPVQKRIVILDKTGQIIKQFLSEKFDNLLDFGVSGPTEGGYPGKTIWLLNGLRVYQVEQ